MKKAMWVWLCITAWGQQAEPPPAAAKPAPPGDQKAAETTAESPVPVTERSLTGSFDVGYRWRTGPAGNENVYRSLVDLGEGPKLLNADFSIFDPKRRWFDRIDTRAANWGDDPYTTLNVAAHKSRVYDFVSSYRNLAYFNNLPSYANPLLERGVLASQRIFDTRNRMSSYELSLLPGNWLMPYFAYERASGYGQGVTTFVSDQNEYPVPLRSNFSQNNMRGGVRLELTRYHATIEQGGTTFRDDQELFQSPGAANPGNNTTTVLGTPLALNGLSQAYGVRGDSIYTKVMGTGQPASWLSLYGQYLYARPQNETNYQQFNTGNFILQSQALAFSSQQYLLSSAAKVPHQSGQVGAEIRLHSRVRVITNWLTDRIDVSGESTGQNSVRGTSAASINVADMTELKNEYNHFEADVLWDVTSHLTLRGGYRYQWGSTSNSILPPTGLASQDMADFRRHVGKGGFNYRLGGKLSVTGDVEGAGTESAYFRTSLFQYQKGRVQGSYQASSQLTFMAAFSVVSNQNPAPDIDFDYLGLQTSASVLWNPAGDKRMGFQGTYTRSTIRSDISFLVPQTFQRDRSQYRDNAHSVQGMFDLALPKLGQQARLSAGGNFFISSGSRPTDYFQPVGKLIVPVAPGWAWVSEWTYYGYGESFYSYEGFRTHLFTTGIRITR
jgi:hypothetical protein